MSDRRIIIRKDRRALGNGGTAPPSGTPAVPWKRTFCWDIAGCTDRDRANCYAFRVKQNCWDLWALRPLVDRHCCQRLPDCRECIIVARKFPENVLVHPNLGAALRTPRRGPVTVLCPHLNMNGRLARPGEIEAFIAETPVGSETALECLQCRLRGTYLDPEYVSTVCASPHYRTCVFLVRF